MKTVQIEILKPMKRYPVVGKIITTEVDSDGIVLDRFLRRRVADSQIDGCVRIIAAAAKKSKEDKVDGKSIAN